MAFYLETGYTSLNHVGEELCGDRVETKRNGDWTTLVLADGLGSGVKANILATLTSKILCTMIAADMDISECIKTVLLSLPVCKERGIAYSTFSVIHVNKEGKGYLFEFDNPQAVYIHGGVCTDLPREKLDICGKPVYASDLSLCDNDVVVVMSDGAIHAGIGMTMNFGWERPEIMEHLNAFYHSDMSARCVACLLAAACNDLYLDKPGDDTTVAALRVRVENPVNVMVGPPVDRTRDDAIIGQFLSGDAKRVVCGGTTSQIVARHLGTTVKTIFDFPDPDVPPIGQIDGIDLTTEGVLTLRKLLELSEKYLSVTDLTPKAFTKKDGASLLAEMLFEQATSVTFYIGQTMNLAHEGLPIDIKMKLKLVEAIAENLRKMGKAVVLNYD